ncbi:MAG: type II secretion system F family protein, partial [Burkholderiaceae bacterium]
ANDMDLENRLKNLELDLVSFKDASKDLFNNITKIHQKDLIVFCIQMEQLISAGVPILEIISDLRDSAESNNMKNLLEDIHETIKSGTMLSDTLSHYPEIFDEVFVGLIAAGEKTGKLNDVFGHLGTHIKWIYEINKKIRKSLYYPAFMLFLMGIIVSIMMMMVIPKLTSFLTSQNIELPFYTKALISTSDFFVKYWYLIFGGLFAAIYFFFQTWQRSVPMQRFMDATLLKAPIFGEVIRKATIARWTRTLATMFAAGVPLVESLDSVGGAAGNAVYLDATKKIQTEVSTGTSLTVAMQNANVFPSMVTQMVSIGEESGALDQMLGKVADFYEAEVDEAVAALSSLMEPMIMVILGVLIGGLVIAMYLPIFKLGSVV